MASELTSDQTDRARRLADALREKLDIDDSSFLRDVTDDLVAWYDDSDASCRTADELVDALLAVVDRPLARLASLQKTLTETLTDDDRPGDDRRLGRLFAKLTGTATDRLRPTDQVPPLDDSWHDNAFLQAVLDALDDPLFVKDDQHRWVLLNDAYCQFMGYPREKLLGKSDYDFFPEDEADVFWQRDDQVLKTGRVDENEETFTDADGNKHVIITKKSRFFDARDNKYLVGLIRDITERKRLEARLDVARRLMSLGTLASGIAHEVNNPLSYVLTNLDYLLDTIDDPRESDRERRDALEAALRGARRVQEVIQGLSTFSEVSDDELQPVDVAEVLRSSVGVASEQIRQHAQLVEDYGDLPLIAGNEQSLNQIFFNLLTNATEAIDAADSDEDHRVTVEARTGRHGDAVIEISDTGEGIAEDIRDHIFDPFFTTRPVGEGTGLGLAICHGLVEAMHGRIEVESTPGEGATFRLTFPPADRTPPPDTS